MSQRSSSSTSSSQRSYILNQHIQNHFYDTSYQENNLEASNVQIGDNNKLYDGLQDSVQDNTLGLQNLEERITNLETRIEIDGRDLNNGNDDGLRHSVEELKGRVSNLETRIKIDRHDLNNGNDEIIRRFAEIECWRREISERFMKIEVAQSEILKLKQFSQTTASSAVNIPRPVQLDDEDLGYGTDVDISPRASPQASPRASPQASPKASQQASTKASKQKHHAETITDHNRDFYRVEIYTIKIFWLERLYHLSVTESTTLQQIIDIINKRQKKRNMFINEIVHKNGQKIACSLIKLDRSCRYHNIDSDSKIVVY